MTSRITYDTNLLRIRELYALNQTTNDFIAPYAVPITGAGGEVFWYSTIEFLSTIAIPPTGIGFLDLLDQIQPGLSSLSTQNGSLFSTNTSSLLGSLLSSVEGSAAPNFSTPMYSTVAGLGSAGYLSTITFEITAATTSNAELREDKYNTANLPLYKANAVCYAGNWFAGGQLNQDGSVSKECLCTTGDPASNWFPINTNFTKINTLLPFTHNSQTYVAAGGTTLTSTGTVKLSLGGSYWRSLETSLTEVYGLAYGEALDTTPYLVAVGTGGPGIPPVQVSVNFSTFTGETTSLTIGRDIVYDPASKTFTAVGYSDGTTGANILQGYTSNWLSYASDYNDVYTVATNGNNEYLAIGMNAFTSTVATARNIFGSWDTGETLFPSGSEYKLRYVSSMYVACGPSSIKYNYDGLPGGWVEKTTPLNINRDIAYDSQTFVTVGRNFSVTPSSLYYSSIGYNSTVNNLINTQFSYTESTILQMSTTYVQVGDYILTANSNFASTVEGLGSVGYLSTVQNEFTVSTVSTSVLYTNSTILELHNEILNVSTKTLFYSQELGSTIEGLGTVGYLSGFTTSTIGGLPSLGYLSNAPTVFDDLYVSDLRFGDVHLTTSSSTVYANQQPFVFTFESESTILELGQTYLSSPTFGADLVSTVANFGQTYISSTQLFSSIDSLGTQALISSFDLSSTIDGLAEFTYLSTVVFEKTLYESSFPSLGTSFSSNLTTSFPFTIVSSNVESNDIFNNYIYNKMYSAGNQNKVYMDIYANIFLKFASPLATDSFFQFTLPYANTNTIDYTLPSGLESLFVDKLMFVTSGANSPSGSGIYLTLNNTNSITGTISVSMPSTNGIFVSINNSD